VRRGQNDAAERSGLFDEFQQLEVSAEFVSFIFWNIADEIAKGGATENVVDNPTAFIANGLRAKATIKDHF
jgi:hypothetical protein